MARRVARQIELTPAQLTVRRLVMGMYAARCRERAAYARHVVLIYEMLTTLIRR